MKVFGIVLLIFSALGFLVAIKNVFLQGGGAEGSASYAMGYIAGSFMLPVLCLIGGLACVRRRK